MLLVLQATTNVGHGITVRNSTRVIYDNPISRSTLLSNNVKGMISSAGTTGSCIEELVDDQNCLQPKTRPGENNHETNF